MAIGKNGAAARQLRTLFNLGTIRELTDGQLLERFATGAGSEAAELAFAALVERHGPMVLRVCRGVLTDTHDTQDAFQATFLVLVKKARGLWVRDSLGPWLHQVAYRTASCARLAAARRARLERCAAQLRNEARVEAYDDGLERVLHEEIERLPERFRAPLVLCDLEGRSHEQAARHLGWPVGTVKSRQARGRERLRERLRRRGIGPDAAVLAGALRLDGASTLVAPALVDSTIKVATQFVAVRAIIPGSAASLAQGVIRSMSITQCLKVTSVVLIIGVTASGAGLLAHSAGLGDQPQPQASTTGTRVDEVPVHVTMPGKLRVTAVERGVVESSANEDAYCLVEGRTTIIRLLPEGSAVKKGQIVCQLDSAALRDQLINQKITFKSAEANYEIAKLTREAGELAFVEYVEGTLKQERSALRGGITVAQSAIQKAEARLERTRAARKRLKEVLAAKGGSASPTDIVAALDIEDRLDAAEQTILTEQTAIELAKSKEESLDKYTRSKTIKELSGNVEKKRMEELAKKAASQLEISKERKLERQILACDIKAPADGIVVYANEPTRAFGGGLPQIEEGAQVRERQKIFSVPDLTHLQINTKVHESQIAKLARNMKAKIRVDAFANETFDGTVIEIAPLPEPTFSSDIKVYIRIDRPLPGLRPGMTAGVEILVSELDNVFSVPVEAIVRYDDRDHAAVKKADGGIEWRELSLGLSNDQVVEVKQGIKAGEQVVVKPLDLLTEQQKRGLVKSPTPPAAKPSRPR